MSKKLTRVLGDESLDTLRDNYEKALKSYKRHSMRSGGSEEKRKTAELNFYKLISAVAANYDKDPTIWQWLITNNDVLKDQCENLPLPEEDAVSEERVKHLGKLLEDLYNVNKQITEREIKLAQKNNNDDTSYSLLWTFVKGAVIVTAVSVVVIAGIKLLSNEDSGASNSMPSAGEAGVGVLLGGAASGVFNSATHDKEIRDGRRERSIYSKRIKLLKELSEFHNKEKAEMEKSVDNINEMK